MTHPEEDREPESAAGALDPALAAVLVQIADALRGLKFGQVTITVQDGVVVQIDRLERTRLKKHDH